ncbi:MAG: hypothetical protein H7Y88_07115, partial [Phycisphaerales bacterium]|nr:hypothetical protein [Phycisphaerales bacterium]
GKNIIASKSVTGRISATLNDVTFTDALDAILHVNGYGYIQEDNFIYVYTVDELVKIQESLKKRVAKVIHLNYLNATDAASFVEPLKSVGGEIKMSSKTEAFAIPDNAPSGADNYANTSTIVVIDFEENIQAIESLIAELDTRPQQVLVEATVVQTALNEANAFGVDFSIIGDLDFTDFLSIGGPRGVADALINGGSGSTGEGLSPGDNSGQALQSTPGNTNGRSTFKVGLVSNDISIFLKALDEVNDTTILSNPKILALNRMSARVLVGRRVGYLNTTSTDTATTQTVEFLDTGTQLYFRPFVSTDGSIRMELKPQVSEAIIRESTDSTGASVSIPDEITQELVTNVIVKDGQTIVLGGLFRESTEFTRRQVPFLGDIPLIGAAFRGHDDETQRSEIIFMITPSLVTDAIMADAAQQTSEDIERLRAGSRQGLLPWSREKMTAAHNVEAEKLAREGNYEKALWNIQRSLALSPLQPDALSLRERITGMREVWPSRSLLESALNEEVKKRAGLIDPAPTPIPHTNPYGHHNLPKEPLHGLERAVPEPSVNAPVAPASPDLTEQAPVTEPEMQASADLSFDPSFQPGPDGQFVPGTTLEPGDTSESSNESDESQFALSDSPDSFGSSDSFDSGSFNLANPVDEHNEQGSSAPTTPSPTTSDEPGTTSEPPAASEPATETVSSGTTVSNQPMAVSPESTPIVSETPAPAAAFQPGHNGGRPFLASLFAHFRNAAKRSGGDTSITNVPTEPTH